MAARRSLRSRQSAWEDIPPGGGRGWECRGRGGGRVPARGARGRRVEGSLRLVGPQAPRAGIALAGCGPGGLEPVKGRFCEFHPQCEQSFPIERGQFQKRSPRGSQTVVVTCCLRRLLELPQRFLRALRVGRQLGEEVMALTGAKRSRNLQVRLSFSPGLRGTRCWRARSSFWFNTRRR